MNDSLRMLLGVAIFVGTFALAAELSRREEISRHQRYIKCLAAGTRTDIQCSFNAVFRRDY